MDFAPTFAGSENARLNRADRIYDGDRLPYGANEFDTVICTQVLEHTPAPQALMAESERVNDFETVGVTNSRS